jgi:folate-dependent tRNA-U54 methylase TrmFO/GidA
MTDRDPIAPIRGRAYDRWAGLTHEQVRELAAIVRRADEAHEVDGGGTRHWVRDHFLPELEEAGWTISAP